MSRLQSILDSARDSLADPQKERWSDDRLLRLLDEGQKTIARIYELLHGETSTFLQAERSLVQLPGDLWRILRCSYDSALLPMVTYSELDSRKSKWMLDTGSELESVVYNNRNLQELKVYPKPDESFLPTPAQFNSVFGVLTSLDAVPADPFGVVVSVNTAEGQSVSFPDPFGVVVSGSDQKQLDIQYIRDPVTLATTASELELPPMFDRALKLYVVGHAFNDDLDTQSGEKAQTALAMYQQELTILGTRARQHSGTRVAPSSPYRGFQ